MDLISSEGDLLNLVESLLDHLSVFISEFIGATKCADFFMDIWFLY